MNSIYVFVANLDNYQQQSSHGERLVERILARAEKSSQYSSSDLVQLRSAIEGGLVGNWAEPANTISLDALLWILDSLAEPVTMSQLRDVRDISVLKEMAMWSFFCSDTMPIPLPQFATSPPEVRHLMPEDAQVIMKRFPEAPSSKSRFIAAAQREMLEIIESIADEKSMLLAILE